MFLSFIFLQFISLHCLFAYLLIIHTSILILSFAKIEYADSEYTCENVHPYTCTQNKHVHGYYIECHWPYSKIRFFCLVSLVLFCFFYSICEYFLYFWPNMMMNYVWSVSHTLSWLKLFNYKNDFSILFGIRFRYVACAKSSPSSVARVLTLYTQILNRPVVSRGSP